MEAYICQNSVNGTLIICAFRYTYNLCISLQINLTWKGWDPVHKEYTLVNVTQAEVLTGKVDLCLQLP